MNNKQKLLIGLVVLTVAPWVFGQQDTVNPADPVSPSEMHGKASDREKQRTIYDDMKRSKQHMAPRQKGSKYNFAGINPKTSKLSTLSNEAVADPDKPAGKPVKLPIDSPHPPKN